MTGIYFHVPLCLKKCPYCDFYSCGYTKERAALYTAAAKRNIEAFSEMGILTDTVYFGGGTPSLLTAEQVSDILDSVQKSVHLRNPEITLEGNPSSLNADKLRGYRSAGVNRLSIGFQSAEDEQLRFLGRLHDAALAEKTVLAAAEAGFENISCDLMIGLRGQNSGSLDRTLDRLLTLPIAHLSAYMLKLEPGTAFDCDEVRAAIPDDDAVSDLYLQLCERMDAAGFEHYEISNWARDGRRSRHNMKYWRVEPYIGIGPSAHSDFGGRRYFCPADLDGFLNADVQKNVHEDDAPDRAQEYVMLGLRLSDGIERGVLSRIGGEDMASEVFTRAESLKSTGMIRLSSGKISLTEKGFLVSNAVILHLLGS